MKHWDRSRRAKGRQRDGAIMVRRGTSSLLVVILIRLDAGKMSMDQPSTPHIESEFVPQDRVPETMLLEGLAVHWFVC